jgi:hypothetical protein
MKGKPTRVDIKIDCSFMKLAPLSVNWILMLPISVMCCYFGKNLQSSGAGNQSVYHPYLHVTATGTIQEMLFNFRGNPKGLNGSFNLKHKDLKIAVLDKNNREKKGF